MNTTEARNRPHSAGFVRGTAALTPDTLVAHAKDLQFLACLNLDENPRSDTARALLRGVELLVLKAHEATGQPSPADIPVISPELLT